MFLSLVLFTASVAAQPPAKSAVKPDAPASEDGPQNALPDVHYLSQQVLGKGISQARLSNGMTVLVQENHAAPVATVRCFIHNTGSAFEGEHLGAGLSHLLEHLVAGGTTTKRSETEIREILDSLGGRLHFRVRGRKNRRQDRDPRHSVEFPRSRLHRGRQADAGND
jgi:zinc protease